MDVRYQLLVFYLLAFISSGWAARRVDANVRARDTMERRRDAAVMKRQEPATLDTKELLQLTEGESMTELRRAKDAHGSTLARLQEEYRGIAVLDSVVTVRKDERGHLTGDASGTLIQDIAEDLPDIEPNLTDEETLEIVIAEEGDADIRESIGDTSYVRLVMMDANDKARLINKVSYLIDGKKKPTYLIDVKSGEILRHWNSFTTLSCCNKSPVKAQLIGGNEKSGKIMYGSQPYCPNFTVDEFDICYLENEYVRVVDMNYTFNENISETASFPCSEAYGDAVNGAYSPAIDAYYYGTVVGKMFEEWYGMTALKDKMIIRVHYGHLYQNAFWNGVNVTLGDGGYMFYPFTNLDDVGHEFGHGVVDEASDLMYFGESGGLNEAFADIMGETSEDYLLSTDYVSGQYVMKNVPYMREFEAPEKDNDSIRHAADMTEDLDPHYSSGVYRRVWYVVVKEQEMSVRDTFNVFLFANQMYWHHLSTFYDASCGLLKAAMDLGLDTKPFAVAFDDVGIPKCDVSSHVFSVANNKTYRGVTVSGTFQPVFGFSMPVWGKKLSVEAISPPDGIVGITLLKGSWEDEEYDSATEVKREFNRLEYYIENGEHQGTTSTPSNSTSELVPEKFFIKLATDDPNDQYNNVELTIGYVCDEKFVSDDFMASMMHHFYC